MISYRVIAVFSRHVAWRVLIALEEKKVTYRSVCVSFSSGVLKTPLFRRLNPRMRVPIFVDGLTGAVVYESLAILEYLEKFYPSHSLLPTDPIPYAIAETRFHEANEFLSSVGELIVYIRRVPDDKRNPQVLQHKWSLVEKELEIWEQYLQSKPYLLGNDIYMCDFVLFTNIAYAVRCGLKLDGVYPNLACFYTRLCARPSIDKTWPPHWKVTCGQPVLSCVGNKMH